MIPKRNGVLRALGIPTARDRTVQAALKLVLEPIFEADFKPCSHGFRPNRRAQDAIAEIHFFASRHGGGHPLPLASRQHPLPMGDRSMNVPAHRFAESRMRGNTHVRFGGADRGNGPSEMTAPRPGPIPTKNGSTARSAAATWSASSPTAPPSSASSAPSSPNNTTNGKPHAATYPKKPSAKACSPSSPTPTRRPASYRPSPHNPSNRERRGGTPTPLDGTRPEQTARVVSLAV